MPKPMLASLLLLLLGLCSNQVVAQEKYETERRLNEKEVPAAARDFIDALEVNYLKVNNEYLNSLQAAAYDLEIRLVPLLGYAVTHMHKLEAGLDYRLNSFLNKDVSHRFWISLSWFVEI